MQVATKYVIFLFTTVFIKLGHNYEYHIKNSVVIRIYVKLCNDKTFNMDLQQ